MVHIPLEQYHRYLQSILKLLFPSPIDYNETGDPDEHEWTSWANRHPFLNVSITPIECSIVCSKQLAQQYLAPTLKALFEKTNKGYDQASVSDDDFVVISVEGEGLEAGQRVLELTSPLALAGMYVLSSLFPLALVQYDVDLRQLNLLHYDLFLRLYSRSFKISLARRPCFRRPRFHLPEEFRCIRQPPRSPPPE